MYLKNRLVKKDAVDRPFYIIEDNAKSSFRIDRKQSFNFVSEIQNNDDIKKIQCRDNYFDNEYLSKIKREAIPYPNNDN